MAPQHFRDFPVLPAPRYVETRSTPDAWLAVIDGAAVSDVVALVGKMQEAAVSPLARAEDEQWCAWADTVLSRCGPAGGGEPARGP